MSDLTYNDKTKYPDCRSSNPKEIRDAVPLDILEKTRPKSRIRGFELGFSAAC